MATTKELIYADYHGETAITPQEQSAWYDVMAKFRAASLAFDHAVADLRSRVIADPALAHERNELLTRAEGMAAKMQYIRSALDDVTQALKGAWENVTGVWESIKSSFGLSGDHLTLQGLPLIPIAAVLAALGLLTAFLSDYAKFVKKANMFQSLVAQGHAPDAASRIVERATQADSLFGLSFAGVPLILWLAGAGALYWFVSRRERR